MTEQTVDVGRIGSGRPEIDAVLHGGFPTHSINVIMGEPGTGKTVLAQQLLFHNAGGDRPVMYLSTLSEPLSKVLAYLQRFRFYDPDRMLGSMLYEDVGEGILREGVTHLLDRLKAIIREHRPRLLVIDSFKAVHDLAADPETMRRLAAELGGLLAAFDVTTFLVGEYVSEEVSLYPEFAVADGVIQLARREGANWDERYLRVLKLRGSGYMEGLHAFTISPDGLDVYPRLVTPSAPVGYQAAGARISTGVEGLDELVGGGFWQGSTTLLLGASGTGKTTAALGYVLEGVRRGEPSLFVTFQENPSQLSESIGRLGAEPDVLRSDGLHLQYASPVELRIDSVVVEMFRTIRKHGVQRVAIDGLSDLLLASTSGERFHDYVYSIVQHLKVAQVTGLLTLDRVDVRRSADERSPEIRLSTVCDAVVVLRMDLEGTEGPRRLVRVVKMRASGHALGEREFVITEGGLRVDPDPGSSHAWNAQEVDHG